MVQVTKWKSTWSQPAGNVQCVLSTIKWRRVTYAISNRWQVWHFVSDAILDAIFYAWKYVWATVKGERHVCLWTIKWLLHFCVLTHHTWCSMWVLWSYSRRSTSTIFSCKTWWVEGSQNWHLPMLARRWACVCWQCNCIQQTRWCLFRSVQANRCIAVGKRNYWRWWLNSYRVGSTHTRQNVYSWGCSAMHLNVIIHMLTIS